jgi:hypothetical protein
MNRGAHGRVSHHPATILNQLAAERPIFHSEADYQHALAWKLHEVYPHSEIRLEYRPVHNEPLYTDIWLRINANVIAIELKYVTRKLDVVIAGERFVLANHGAQPLRRCDFLKDVVRLERCIDAYRSGRGYVVMLTNESAYWWPTLGRQTTDAAFRIHEGRTLEGAVRWSDAASEGMTRKRESDLAIRGNYALQWRDYSTIPVDRAGRFRYLLIEIPGK